MSFGLPLSEADAALLESSIVPTYLSFFGSLLASMILPASPAAVAQLGARTGFPAELIAERLPRSFLCGVDPSRAAVERARAGVSRLSGALDARYEVADGLPTQLAEARFTHALAIHPLGDASARAAVLAELRRVLVPGGHALLALPLRGSFPEVIDMLREFGLRENLGDFGASVDALSASRPSIETLVGEFEAADLHEVDVDVQLATITFPSGKAFLDDPSTRLFVFEDTRALLPVSPELSASAMAYVREAIGKYWSEGPFELTVNVGCASGRRLS